MKLSEYKETFYTHTGKASDASRQLSFAGIAVIWVLGRATLQNIFPVHALTVAMLLFALSLMSDLFQYTISSIIWWFVFRYHEVKKTEGDPEVMVSFYWQVPGWTFWTLKIVFVLSGYLCVVAYVLKILNTALF